MTTVLAIHIPRHPGAALGAVSKDAIQGLPMSGDSTLGQKPFGPLRSYGRIKSRPIKARQAGLMDSLLPKIALDVSGPLDPRTLKPDAAEVWLEIGFGGGEHMAAQGGRRPDVLILGAEPFLNGVASAVRHVEEQALANVRILHGDARALMMALPDASLDRVFILFPDPWPKTRHHKRRIVQTDTLAELARLLKPGGRLRFATDWAEYADWALERALADPAFDWSAARADDWRRPPADHVTTRYEEKKLGDCAPVFLDFVRR
jgi:tRNA (guanine-N7-)-methyltransferase